MPARAATRTRAAELGLQLPMKRAEAIAWLQSVGRLAYPRNWAMGETICIPIGKARLEKGITFYPRMIYLCPQPYGLWNVLDDDSPGTPPVADLATAVRYAHEHATRLERGLVMKVVVKIDVEENGSSAVHKLIRGLDESPWQFAERVRRVVLDLVVGEISKP